MLHGFVDSYSSVFLEVVRDVLEWGTSSVASHVFGALPTAFPLSSSTSSSIFSSSSNSMGETISEDVLHFVCKKNEAKMSSVIRSALAISSGGIGADDAEKTGRHIPLVIDVIMMVRSSLHAYFTSGSFAGKQQRAEYPTGYLFDAGTTNDFSALSIVITSLVPHILGSFDPIGRAAGGALPPMSVSESAFVSRRMCAIVDVLWMKAIILLFRDVLRQSQQPCVSPSLLAQSTGSSGAVSFESSSLSSSVKLPQSAPVAVETYNELSIHDLAKVPWSFFMRKWHITEIENLVCSWVIRDAEVFLPWRKMFVSWSADLFSIICAVDVSVAAPLAVLLQEGMSQRYRKVVSDKKARDASHELHISVGDEQPNAEEERGGAVIALDSWMEQAMDDQPVNYPTNQFPIIPAELNTLVLFSGQMNFVEKYVKALLSIIGDLQTYKNYSGLMKYCRLLSSLRVESNTFLITLTTVMVDLAASSKGRKEVKSIFTEFVAKLLVPLAHTPPSWIDAWALRNTEFILCHHLADWETKSKYASVVIPSMAATLGCCSVAVFAKKILPFFQLVAKSLPEISDRRLRAAILASLHHALGASFRHLKVIGRDSALPDGLGALHRDIFTLLAVEIIPFLKRQALTSQQSAKIVEAGTELFVTVAREMATEGAALLLDLLPSDAGCILTEATAIGLSALSVVSDVIFSREEVKDMFVTPYLVWSSGEKSLLPPKALSGEDDVLGLVSFPSSPFAALQRSSSSSTGGGGASDGVDPAASTCFVSGREIHVSSTAAQFAILGSSTGGGGGQGTIASLLDHVFSSQDEDVETFFRKLGAQRVHWPGDRVGCRSAFLQKEEQFLKKICLILASMKDLFVAPGAASSRGGSSSIISSSRGGSNSASVVYFSSLTDKEKASQKLLIATMLAARYWSPVSALMAEIPRALVHWNHTLALVTSTIVIPHFVQHPRYAPSFASIVVSRLCEATSLAHEDRDAVLTFSKQLVDISRIILQEIKIEANTSLQTLPQDATHFTAEQNDNIVNVAKDKLRDACRNVLSTSAALPQSYYTLVPFSPPTLSVELQAFSILDILDGTSLLLLSSGDANVRESALLVSSIVSHIARLLQGWKRTIDTAEITIIGRRHSRAPSASGSSPFDVDLWLPAGDQIMANVCGRSLVEQVCEDWKVCGSVGCHWPEESKAYRLICPSSPYSRPPPPQQQARDNQSSSTSRVLSAPHRLLYSARGQCLESLRRSDLSEAYTAVARLLTDDSVAPNPSYCVVAANVALATALHFTASLRESSKALVVASRLASFTCQQVASFQSILEDRFVIDTWRSSFAFYFVLLMVEPHPLLREGAALQQTSTASTAPAAVAGGHSKRKPHHQHPQASSRGSGDSSVSSSNIDWMLTDKSKKVSELMTGLLGLFGKYTGLQDVFDLPAYLFARPIQSALQQPTHLVLFSSYVFAVTEFTKRFLDDPVRSLARKDKRKALSYCAVAAPALHTCAKAILEKGTLSMSASNRQKIVPPSGGSSSTASQSTTVQSTYTATADTQLQLVKFFDVLDALIAVLVTGNFSSTVAGSNAPTSSSSHVAKPLEHELMRSGGVSTLASLPAIPPTRTLISVVQYATASLTSRAQQQQQSAPLRSTTTATNVIADDQWPLQGSNTAAEVDSVGNHPVLVQVAWGAPGTMLTFDQSLSIRIRFDLHALFASLFLNEVVCSTFLRDRTRLITDFLFFNVHGNPLRSAVRVLFDAQHHNSAARYRNSSFTSCLCETHGASASNWSMDVPCETYSPLHHYRNALSSFGLGLLCPSNAIEAPLYFTKLMECLLEHVTGSLNALGKQFSSSNTGAIANSSSLATLRASLFPHSCFVASSPFRSFLETVAAKASWGAGVFRSLVSRLAESVMGSTNFLFFAEVVFILAASNPSLLRDEDGNSLTPLSVPMLQRSDQRGVKLATDFTRTPLIVVTALAILTSNDPCVSAVASRGAFHVLHLIYSPTFPQSSVSNIEAQRTTTTHHQLDYWIALMRLQHDVLYSRNRSKNHYNRILDIALYYLVNQKLVLSNCSSWIQSQFRLVTALMDSVELSDDKQKLLLTVCKMYRSDIPDGVLIDLFANLDLSSIENKSKFVFRMLQKSPQDQEFFFSIFDPYFKLVLSMSHGGSGENSSASYRQGGGDRSRSPSIGRLPSPGKTPTKYGKTHSEAKIPKRLLSGLADVTVVNSADYSIDAVDRKAPYSPALQRNGLAHVMFCQCLYQLSLWRRESSRRRSSDEALPHEPQQDESVTSIITKDSLWDHAKVHWKRSAANPVNQPPQPAPATGGTPRSFNAATLNEQGTHFHEINDAAQCAMQEANMLLLNDITRSQGFNSTFPVDEFVPWWAFSTAASAEVEAVLLKPMTSLLLCLGKVSRLVLKDRSLLSDAAVELGLADTIPKHLYITQTRKPQVELSPHRLAPHNNNNNNNHNNVRKSNLRSPPLPPNFSKPLQKKHSSHTSPTKPGTGAYTLPPAVTLPEQESDNETISNASDDTIIVHESCGHAFIPALLTVDDDLFSNTDPSCAVGSTPTRAANALPKQSRTEFDVGAFEQLLVSALHMEVELSVVRSLGWLLLHAPPVRHRGSTQCLRCDTQRLLTLRVAESTLCLLCPTQTLDSPSVTALRSLLTIYFQVESRISSSDSIFLSDLFYAISDAERNNSSQPKQRREIIIAHLAACLPKQAVRLWLKEEAERQEDFLRAVFTTTPPQLGSPAPTAPHLQVVQYQHAVSLFVTQVLSNVVSSPPVLSPACVKDQSLCDHAVYFLLTPLFRCCVRSVNVAAIALLKLMMSSSEASFVSHSSAAPRGLLSLTCLIQSSAQTAARILGESCVVYNRQVGATSLASDSSPISISSLLLFAEVDLLTFFWSSFALSLIPKCLSGACTMLSSLFAAGAWEQSLGGDVNVMPTALLQYSPGKVTRRVLQNMKEVLSPHGTVASIIVAQYVRFYAHEDAPADQQFSLICHTVARMSNTRGPPTNKENSVFRDHLLAFLLVAFAPGAVSQFTSAPTGHTEESGFINILTTLTNSCGSVHVSSQQRIPSLLSAAFRHCAQVSGMSLEYLLGDTCPVDLRAVCTHFQHQFVMTVVHTMMLVANDPVLEMIKTESYSPQSRVHHLVTVVTAFFHEMCVMMPKVPLFKAVLQKAASELISLFALLRRSYSAMLLSAVSRGIPHEAPWSATWTFISSSIAHCSNPKCISSLSSAIPSLDENPLLMVRERGELPRILLASLSADSDGFPDGGGNPSAPTEKSKPLAFSQQSKHRRSVSCIIDTLNARDFTASLADPPSASDDNFAAVGAPSSSSQFVALSKSANLFTPFVQRSIRHPVSSQEFSTLVTMTPSTGKKSCDDFDRACDEKLIDDDNSFADGSVGDLNECDDNAKKSNKCRHYGVYAFVEDMDGGRYTVPAELIEEAMREVDLTACNSDVEAVAVGIEGSQQCVAAPPPQSQTSSGATLSSGEPHSLNSTGRQTLQNSMGSSRLAALFRKKSEKLLNVTSDSTDQLAESDASPQGGNGARARRDLDSECSETGGDRTMPSDGGGDLFDSSDVWDSPSRTLGDREPVPKPRSKLSGIDNAHRRRGRHERSSRLDFAEKFDEVEPQPAEGGKNQSAYGERPLMHQPNQKYPHEELLLLSYHSNSVQSNDADSSRTSSESESEGRHRSHSSSTSSAEVMTS